MSGENNYWIAVKAHGKSPVVDGTYSHDEAIAKYNAERKYWGLPDEIFPPFMAQSKEEAEKEVEY